MKRRILSILVVLSMVLTMIPAALAVETGETQKPTLPTATVTKIENTDLTFAMNFKADTATEEQLAYYGNWYADYVLTVNKEVTFNANGTADGWLSGQYDAYSENWVNVPFEDVTLKANESLKIMEYAATLMGQSGLKLTYNDVYSFVKDFDCGVFFNEKFLSDNTDLVVTLELRMYNPENESESYVIGNTYTFGTAQSTSTFTVSGDLTVEGASEETVDAIIVDIQSNTALSGADYNPIEGVEGVEELAVTLSGIEMTEDSITKIVYTVEPKDENGEKISDPEASITFRLPIPESVTEQYAKVYHDGKLMGVYEIQGEGNGKYVEIESGSFSEFAVEPLSLTQVATKEELVAAIAAAEDGDTIQLTANIDYAGTATMVIDKAITLDLGGYTLTTNGTYGGIQLKGNCTLQNGTLAHKGTVTAIKAWNVAAIKDLVIDVAFKAEGKTIGGIVLQEGSNIRIDTIENVVIKGEGLTNGIETYNCGNATEPVIGSMKNVTINAKGTGMLISAPCGTATNCTIEGDVSGIEIWIKGTYSATLDLVNCEVEGGEQAVYAHDEFNSDPNIVNEGTLKLTADEDTTFESVSKALLKLTIARAENVDVDEVIENAIAKVVVDETTETYYATTAAANNAKEEGEEVVVLKNLEEIWTKEDLIAFAEAVDNGDTFEGKTVKLMADIDLENELFEPIGSYRNDTAFKGRFDGQGHSIKNLSQNTWELNNGYYYGDLGLGLFGLVEDATIKNLTIDGAEISGESAICGTVAACAYGDCVFENITIKNANVADYQYYAGGIVGWASGNHQYINCNIDETTTIAAQWGDFDNSTGGVIGGCGSSATILMKDCTIACRLDVYNDVTSSYQWYAYRRCGMLIGNTGKTAEGDAYTAAAPQLTTENVTVIYGDWAHYHYCEFAGKSWPYVRVEAGISNSAYSNPRYGHPTDAEGNEVVDDNHVHNEGEDHFIHCDFNQLYGGGQGVYGASAHEGVTAIIPAEARIGDTEYWTLAEAIDAAQEDDVIELLKNPCEKCMPSEIEDVEIVVTVTFDSNGGSAVESQTVDYGIAATQPAAPTKVGYTFTGWYLNGEKYDFNTPVTTAITLEAHWEYAPIYIPYVPNTSSTPDASETNEECDGGAGCSSVVFTDVNTALWYHEALDFVITEGIMKGTGDGTTFEPTSSLTRAMMWTMLARMEGVDAENAAPWYAKAQTWATGKGISDGTDPNGSITREQLVTMLWRYAGEASARMDVLAQFADADNISGYAVRAMAWAVENGILEGSNGELMPEVNASRAEVAAIMMRFCEMDR